MKIIQLHSENVKRVNAVDITPQDNVIVLSGKNGAGKSSVIDSIWLALQYKNASKKNPTPLRAGEDKGVVEVDLGNYIVTRKFTPSGSTLEIRTPDNSKITSPQKLLDGLIGDLSFDPWEFAQKSEKDQRVMLADVLFSISEGKLDLAGFDVKRQSLYDLRVEANREKKRLTTLLTQLAAPTAQDPTQEVSIEDLTRAIAQAVQIRTNVQTLTNREKELDAKIKQIEQELANYKAEKTKVVQELEKSPEVMDVDFLQSQLSGLQSHNRRAREVQDYTNFKNALNAIDDEIQRLNDAMELVDIEKAEALEASPLPVKNLKVTEEGIQIITNDNNAVPFCQASTALQLRISLAIAMAANPKLRVIRIANGALLDDECMDIIRDMARDQDFQVWIEYNSRNEQDRVGIYIEDGSVVV